MSNKLTIRNSTAEFLIFTQQAGEDGIEVRYEEGAIWLTQKLMAELFDVTAANVNTHIKNIYEEKELVQNLTIKEFLIVQKEGERQVSRSVAHYNLDVIISVGYRINSKRATQFRQWATQILKEFAVKGFVLDKKRLENGNILGEDYFEQLLAEIREIRLSERRFYQKITDIYATSVDYNKNAPTTRDFFAKVQNKLHYAIHGHTAAELVRERADSSKPFMGLTNWEGSPNGKILKTDVSIAKNYLSSEEVDSLGRIVNAYLELAEDRAIRKIPMTMEDWAIRLDKFLEFDERDVLQNAGKISATIAKDHAENEFEKYRIVQDSFFESDFDKEIKAIIKGVELPINNKHKLGLPLEYQQLPEYFDAHNVSDKTEAKNALIERLLKSQQVHTVLDMTCGTGSQVFYLIERGYEVIGSDFSPALIEIARNKASNIGKNITFLEGDMCELQVGKFDAVITIFNAIGHLVKKDFEKALRNIHANLKDNGVYIFDIFNLQALTDEIINDFAMDIESTVNGVKIRNVQHSKIDRKNGFLTSHDDYTIYKNEKAPEIYANSFSLQIYTVIELQTMLAENGFEIVHQYDMDGNDFIANKSLSILTIARKKSR